MSSLVIVAIPREDDVVWKVSSEKVPHLTLMYLGEVQDDNSATRMAEFVEHALNVNQHGPFYLEVDYRGELGPDKADVLFFENGWDSKWIKSLRGQLLKQSDIHAAYVAEDQYPDWVPHLTLGYPATPAKPMPDYQERIYSVQFDRIAVWTGDYDGPEFRLKWPERDYAEDSPIMAMSSINQARAAMGLAVIDDTVEHHGVKGMKWGVRNDRKGRDRFNPEGHSVKGDVARAMLLPIPGTNIPALVRLGKRANQGTKAYMEKRQRPEEVAKREKRKLARKDFYWEMHAYSDISHADVHNKVADDIDSKVFQLQSAPKYRGKNLKTDKKLADEYDQDVAKVTDAAYRRAVKDTYGVNPSGTKSAHYVNDVRGARIEIRDRTSGKTLAERELNPVSEDINDTVRHAATSSFEDPEIMMTVKTNENGFITEIGRVKLPEDNTDGEIAQAGLSGQAFIESLLHYGVKGMHWGQRKAEPSAVTPSASSRVPHGDRRKTKIDVEGGQNHPAHPDAIKVAEARAKLRKSGAAALSNKELQDLQTRLNLERNVEQLANSKTTIGKGRKFVREFTGFNREINESVGTGLQTNRLARQVRG